ncbi:Prophage CP4-57 regulatory protein (AlpA) [compost metagenome]
MQSSTPLLCADAHQSASGHRILRLPEVIHRTGFKRSTIYKMIQEGCFPGAVKLTSRAVGWDSRAIDAWINERIGLARNGYSSAV